MSDCAARLVYRPEYASYDFGPAHPLRPVRIRAALELCQALALETPLLAAPAATLDELHLVHARGYLDAVQSIDAFADEPMVLFEAGRWGLGPGDSPAFVGMHESSALIAGGSLHAVRAIMQGEIQHAFNPSGGLHHAQLDRASGFCIYNDAAVAIAALLRERDARVLYLDFDAHHGDGVQNAFYDDPRVLTLSIHETGRHLFPGTGFLHELGTGAGRGYSLNVPVEPFTEDNSWLEALDLLVPAVADWFAPDIIVSQHGCDSHAWDPLTHLHLSTRAFAAQARLVHTLAHRVAHGRWLALGGGGYDWARVVPRSWTLVWGEMSRQPLPEALPAEWLSRWAEIGAANDFAPMPGTLIDDTATWREIPRRAAIEETNRARVVELRRLVVPALVRAAYPAHELLSALPEAFEPRSGHVDTPRGRVLLRDLCPALFLERLQPDTGLAAFTRRAVREYALLVEMASSGRGAVAVAHTEDGAIVGHAVLTPADEWYPDVADVYELSVATSDAWRRLGIARALLDFVLSAPWIEQLVLIAVAQASHPLHAALHRAGFTPRPGDDGLLVRVGRAAHQQAHAVRSG